MTFLSNLSKLFSGAARGCRSSCHTAELPSACRPSLSPGWAAPGRRSRPGWQHQRHWSPPAPAATGPSRAPPHLLLRGRTRRATLTLAMARLTARSSGRPLRGPASRPRPARGGAEPPRGEGRAGQGSREPGPGSPAEGMPGTFPGLRAGDAGKACPEQPRSPSEQHPNRAVLPGTAAHSEQETRSDFALPSKFSLAAAKQRGFYPRAQCRQCE